MDKVQAKYWYEAATKNGSIIAKDILKKHYNTKVKIEANKTKEIKLQKILSFKRLSQFGLRQLRNKINKNDQEKGFNYIQKVTESRYKMIPFDLNNCCKKKGVRKDGRKAFEYHKTSAKQGNMNAKFQLGYC